MENEEALADFYGALLHDDAEDLYQRAPCGYLSTTPDGTITKVNQTFLTWTGRDRADLVGRMRFADLLTVGGRIYHETHYAPMLQMQGHARQIALDIVRADGRRLPALVNAVMDTHEDGSPSVVRVAIFDASERREYERELLRAKERAEQSEARALLLARTLQRSLMPPTPPDVEGLELSAVYRPAGAGDEIGGDFYDVFQLGVDDWVVAIGDVQGKGVQAAVVTLLARHTIRAAAVQHPEPSQVLATLNHVLVVQGVDRFCTVAVARLRRDPTGEWRAVLGLGGHPLPILKRADAASGPVGRPGSLIGFYDEVDVTDTELLLDSGDSLVLYTDGVTEGRRGDSWFGEARLTDSIDRGAATAHDLAEGILEDVLAFQGGLPRDDIAVVALRVP